MKLLVLSPPDDEPSELGVVQALFEQGLTRYHLRKPGFSLEQMAAWLSSLPAKWREHVWLHSHHELALDFHVGGIHFRDEIRGVSDTMELLASGQVTSRSCHDVATLKAAVGRHQALLWGPVFASFSKPGYGPMTSALKKEVQEFLVQHTADTSRKTQIYAVGGVTTEGVAMCRSLGFDGVAVLGAIWHAANPVAAYEAFKAALAEDAVIDSKEST